MRPPGGPRHRGSPAEGSASARPTRSARTTAAAASAGPGGARSNRGEPGRALHGGGGGHRARGRPSFPPLPGNAARPEAGAALPARPARAFPSRPPPPRWRRPCRCRWSSGERGRRRRRGPGTRAEGRAGLGSLGEAAAALRRSGCCARPWGAAAVTGLRGCGPGWRVRPPPPGNPAAVSGTAGRGRAQPGRFPAALRCCPVAPCWGRPALPGPSAPRPRLCLCVSVLYKSFPFSPFNLFNFF